MNKADLKTIKTALIEAYNVIQMQNNGNMLVSIEDALKKLNIDTNERCHCGSRLLLVQEDETPYQFCCDDCALEDHDCRSGPDDSCGACDVE